MSTDRLFTFNRSVCYAFFGLTGCTRYSIYFIRVAQDSIQHRVHRLRPGNNLATQRSPYRHPSSRTQPLASVSEISQSESQSPEVASSPGCNCFHYSLLIRSQSVALYALQAVLLGGEADPLVQDRRAHNGL